MRQKLSEKYYKEREEICEKILFILKLDINNSFILSDFDDNMQMQKQLLDMKEEIQKYFACSTISSFKPNFECKRPYLNLVRGILRKQGYIFNSSNIVLKKENGENIITKKYFIFRNN